MADGRSLFASKKAGSGLASRGLEMREIRAVLEVQWFLGSTLEIPCSLLLADLNPLLHKFNT